MRDVDDVHHAEDQRETGGEQRVDAADQHAERQRLEQLGHAVPLLPVGLGVDRPSWSWPGRPAPRSRPCRSATAPSRKYDCGAPVASQLSSPRIVWTSLACSQSASAFWSILPTASTAAWSTWRRGERVGGVLGRRLAVVRLRVRRHELGVQRRLGLLVPAHRVEDALGVGHADAVAVLAGSCSAPRSGRAPWASSRAAGASGSGRRRPRRPRPAPPGRACLAAMALAMVWKFVVSGG